jgi:hypothetical protein
LTEPEIKKLKKYLKDFFFPQFAMQSMGKCVFSLTSGIMFVGINVFR